MSLLCLSNAARPWQIFVQVTVTTDRTICLLWQVYMKNNLSHVTVFQTKFQSLVAAFLGSPLSYIQLSQCSCSININIMCWQRINIPTIIKNGMSTTNQNLNFYNHFYGLVMIKCKPSYFQNIKSIASHYKPSWEPFWVFSAFCGVKGVLPT